MYDLHTHTFLSDGVLCPSELVQRFAVAGYKGIVIADHVDYATLDHTVPRIVKFCKDMQEFLPIKVIPGCELTHFPPKVCKKLVKQARDLGARIIIVHGETTVEPVWAGTNREGIVSGADIIAHPGLVTEDDANVAAERGVRFEITSRVGHCYSNAHVIATARKMKTSLVYGTDFHEPSDLLRPEMVSNVLQGAGLSIKEAEKVIGDTADFFKSKL